MASDVELRQGYAFVQIIVQITKDDETIYCWQRWIKKPWFISNSSILYDSCILMQNDFIGYARTFNVIDNYVLIYE